MPMPLPISEAFFHRLKAATRDLVKLCGGVERAGALCHMSKTEVSRWQTSGGPIVPIVCVLALEADCGVPIVTTVMADINGRRLSDPDGGEDEDGEAPAVMGRHAESVRAAAEMMAAGAAAFADGQLTPAEAEILDRTAATVERTLVPLRLALAGAKGGAGLRSVK